MNSRRKCIWISLWNNSHAIMNKASHFSCRLLWETKHCATFTILQQKKKKKWRCSGSTHHFHDQRKLAHSAVLKRWRHFSFDEWGPLLVDWLPHGTTVNTARYRETMHKVCKAIKIKQSGKLSNDTVLIHDNARPYVTNECVETPKMLLLGSPATPTLQFWPLALQLSCFRRVEKGFK